MKMKLQSFEKNLIRLALREDIYQGDPTTDALIPTDKQAYALISARAEGIICGLNAAKIVFKTVDPRTKFNFLVSEGSRVKANTPLAEVKAKARTLFKAERTVLNFIQHLSGISTFTGQFVKKTKHSSVKITDTRKTIPGLRSMEKYAVKLGGGVNHRMTLGDFILIKDNHWQFFPDNSLVKGIREIRKIRPKMKIEVEVEKIEELKKVLEAGIDIIMLDNMDYTGLKEAIKFTRNWQRKKTGRKIIIEISGGINLNNISRVASLGADQISIGALTHSAPAFPVDMEIVNASSR